MTDIARRKDHHLDLCIEKPVESDTPAGLDDYAVVYDALPETDLDNVDLSTTIFGKRLAAPIIIGAMTGGSERAASINAVLAQAASRVGVGMALGSQRAMIVDPSLTSSYDVRVHAPELPLLIGNLGAVQLNYGVDASQIEHAITKVGADAIAFHLNPLQEAIQPEGDTRFAGLYKKLSATIPQLRVPAMVKEVGGGISAGTAAKLAGLPLAGIETAGVGGTSWARVESYRAPQGSPSAAIGQRLAGFGVPTARSIVHCRRAFGDRIVIASGGMRTGMHAAVAIALGADAVAIARPLLAAALDGLEAVVEALELLVRELQIICFCAGASNLAALRGAGVVDLRGAPVEVGWRL